MSNKKEAVLPKTDKIITSEVKEEVIKVYNKIEQQTLKSYDEPYSDTYSYDYSNDVPKAPTVEANESNLENSLSDTSHIAEVENDNTDNNN